MRGKIKIICLALIITGVLGFYSQPAQAGFFDWVSSSWSKIKSVFIKEQIQETLPAFISEPLEEISSPEGKTQEITEGVQPDITAEAPKETVKETPVITYKDNPEQEKIIQDLKKQITELKEQIKELEQQIKELSNKLLGLKGEKGEKGDKGEKGEQGLRGEKGELPEGRWHKYCLDDGKLEDFEDAEKIKHFWGMEGIEWEGWSGEDIIKKVYNLGDKDVCEDWLSGQWIYLWVKD